MQEPVIVQGMHKSGTTLVSQMVHQGGIVMIEDGLDPRYDNGGAYERELVKMLNRRILGRKPGDLEALWKVALSPLSEADLHELEQSVGDAPWGFKDPRTIWTYSEWTRHFPHGARLYVYRDHLEVMRHFCRKKSFHVLRMKRALLAWLHYNEKLVENYRLDEKSDRPCAVVCYGDLMAHGELIARLAERTGLNLRDARLPEQYRNQNAPRRWLMYRLVALPYAARIKRLHRVLDELRLHPETSTQAPSPEASQNAALTTAESS